jgi:hypothetical protein
MALVGTRPKRAAVRVTLCALDRSRILARSASGGSGYPRLRIGLVCCGCYPQLNPAGRTAGIRPPKIRSARTNPPRQRGVAALAAEAPMPHQTLVATSSLPACCGDSAASGEHHVAHSDYPFYANYVPQFYLVNARGQS